VIHVVLSGRLKCACVRQATPGGTGHCAGGTAGDFSRRRWATQAGWGAAARWYHEPV